MLETPDLVADKGELESNFQLAALSDKSSYVVLIRCFAFSES